MRNFLAVLRDSYREAMNGWLLQAMGILILLILILVFSISFRQLSVQEVAQARFDLLNALLGQNPVAGQPEWSIENVTGGDPVEPWASGHEFDLVLTFPSAEDLRKAYDARLPISRSETELMFKEFGVFKGVKLRVVEQPLDVANEDFPDGVTGLLGGPAKPLYQDREKRVDPRTLTPEQQSAKYGPPAGKPTPVKVRYHVIAEGTTITERKEWPHEITILFAIPVNKTLMAVLGWDSPRDVVYMCENYLVNGFGGWILCMLAVIITASFVPNMMNKGALDLLVSKPIGRIPLLVYKYIGGLTFMFLLTSLSVLGVYITLGVRTGMWAPNFLLAVPLLTLQFAILYAVSTLIGVLTRNALVAILVTLVAWFIFFAVGKVNDGIRNHGIENKKFAEKLKKGELEEFDPRTGKLKTREQIEKDFNPNRPLWGLIDVSAFPVVQSIHAIFPRTFQLDARIGRVIAEGVLTERQQKTRGWDDPPDESWPELILVNLAFITVMLGLASWRFVTRDG